MRNITLNNNVFVTVGRFCTSTIILLVLVFVATVAYQPTALAQDYNGQVLVGVDFSGQDLTDSSFTKANLTNSNLSHSTLEGVSLFGANFEGANLEGTNLRFATIDTATFKNANLTNAILEGAYGFSAKFPGAIIDGADFTDVLLRPETEEELCSVAKGTNPLTGRNTRETLFCY